ncbi:MAG: hypothetical protein V4507_09825 [Verrucomicrobiota bacterium]
MLIFFFAQYLTAAMEEVGSIPCHDECEKEVSSNPSDSDSNDHCVDACGCHFLNIIFESSTLSFAPLSEKEFIFSNFNQSLPQGPVFGIEYPPQMIS